MTRPSLLDRRSDPAPRGPLSLRHRPPWRVALHLYFRDGPPPHDQFPCLTASESASWVSVRSPRQSTCHSSIGSPSGSRSRPSPTCRPLWSRSSASAIAWRRRHASRLWTALLSSPDIDALMILTSGSHGDAIMAGLDRGVAVFAEKPLAWTLGEADAIAARLAADRAVQAPGRLHEALRPGGRRGPGRRGRRRAGRADPIDRGPRPPPDERDASSPTPACCRPRPTSRPRRSPATSRPRAIACRRRRSGRPRRRWARSTRTSCSGASSTSWPSSGPCRRPGRHRCGRRLARRGVAAFGRDRRASRRRGAVRRSAGTSCRTTRPIARRSASSPSRRRSSWSSPRPTCSTADRPAVIADAATAAAATRSCPRRSRRHSRSELLAFHALVVDGTRAEGGIAEGRADIVTCQRAIVGPARAGDRPSRSTTEAAGLTERDHRPPRPAHPLGSRVVRAVPGLPDAPRRARRPAARPDGRAIRGCASLSTARPRPSTTTSRCVRRPSR